MKFFSTLPNLFGEFRIYRRDENGKIVKENDHLMDALRYGIRTGINIAEIEKASTYDEYEEYEEQMRESDNYAATAQSSGGGY